MRRPKGQLGQAYDEARKQGWVMTLTNSQHIRWTPPDGTTVVITTAHPRNGRNTEQYLSDLTKAGLVLSFRGRPKKKAARAAA